MRQSSASGQRIRRVLMVLPSTILFSLSVVLPVQAQRWLQPDSIPAMKWLYHVPDTEFTTSARLATTFPKTAPQYDHVSTLWDFMDSVGIDILFEESGIDPWRYINAPASPARDTATYNQWDTLAQTATGTHKLIPSFRQNLTTGQEVVFYPFDSVHSKRWPCVFTGMKLGNAVPGELGPTEVEYRSPAITPGDSIAWGIAYNYGDIHQSTDYLLAVRPGPGKTYYFVVTGHLFSTGTADTTASLLQMEIWYKIGAGTTYLLGGHSHLAGIDTSILYYTIEVPKDSLRRRGTESFSKYHIASFPVNLDTMVGSPPGPLRSGNTSKKFDVVVKWTGAEPVALRSIAIRDSIGEMLLGMRPESDIHRNNIVKEAQRLLYGPDSTDTDRAKSILYLYATGDEPIDSYAGPFAAVDSLIRRHVRPKGSSTTDSAFAGLGDAFNQSFLDLTDAPAIQVEFAYHDKPNSIPWSPLYGSAFGVPMDDPPSIVEHNGGNYMVHLLTVDSAGVEDYETTLQRGKIGSYSPAINDSAFPFNTLALNGLWRAAEQSRLTGRPLFAIPGTANYLGKTIDSVRIKRGASIITLTILDSSLYGDTLLQEYSHYQANHFMEASEFRMIANLMLCYGVRGCTYWWLGNSPRILNKTRVFRDSVGNDKVIAQGTWDGFGPMGPVTTDRWVNTVDYETICPWVLTVRDTLPGFYVGYKNVMTEITNTDSWLKRMGGAMMRRGLRWRDSYSVHADTVRASPNDTRDSNIRRSLPTTEIITQVTSRPIHSTYNDPKTLTYVELGLFYTKRGMSDSVLLDTNYVYIVNRRTFERGAEIDSSTARGDSMDMFDGTRVITLKFHLQHPDSSQYNFIRVREIEPDSTPLAYLHGHSRQPLDTVLRGDSVATLVLGPGRAALLEIRYVPPADSIIAGDLRFNGQHKILWDGLRYHCVFQRDTLHDSKIYYRRSVPIRSRTDEAGRIQWEPPEYEVSSDSTNTPFNCFPSLTLRIDGIDTVVSVTWDRHRSGGGGNRQIVMRQIHYDTNAIVLGQNLIEDVGYHIGDDTTKWGTPVISALDGGSYVIAWSDSTVGLVAQLRKANTGSEWWKLVNYGSQYLASSVQVAANVPSIGGSLPWDNQYPSMPAMTHIQAHDSTVSLVWQATNFIDYHLMLPNSTIGYVRLWDSAGVKLKILTDTINWGRLYSPHNFNYHPSIDDQQDVWQGLYDGVVWEGVVRMGLSPKGAQLPDNRFIVHASLYTPADPNWRSNDSAMQQWTAVTYQVGTIPHGSIPSLYPSTASLNQRYDSISQSRPILYSVVYYDSASLKMYDQTVHFAEATTPFPAFAWSSPQNYLFGGTYPNAAAIRVIRAPWDPVVSFGHEADYREPLRMAVLYKIKEGGDSLLRTSKQFFAKTRPSGYMATGRQVILGLNNSLAPRICVGMHDVWYATNNSGGGVVMTERDGNHFRTDSLQQVSELLRSGSFYAGDSVQIGCQLSGRLLADSLGAGNASVTCIAEVVDSASGIVVAQLDSFAINIGSPYHYEVKEPVMDLVTGWYYIRLRIDTTNMPVLGKTSFSKYPVIETSSWVNEDHLSKLTRIDGETGSKARISAQPNPFGTNTEIRFSVPKRDYATVTVYDQTGRAVAVLLPNALMDVGRYGVDFDGSMLQPGTYIVELKTSRERVVEKLVLVR